MKRYSITTFNLSNLPIYGIIAITFCVLTSCYSPKKHDGTFTINNNCDYPIRYYFSASGGSYCNCFSSNKPKLRDSFYIRNGPIFDNAYVSPDSSQTFPFHYTNFPSVIMPYNYLHTHYCLVVYKEHENWEEQIIYKTKIRSNKLLKKDVVINIDCDDTPNSIREP